MNSKTPRLAGSGIAGKKLLFLVAAIVLVAAACNKDQSYSQPPGYSNGEVESQTGPTPPPAPTPAPAKPVTQNSAQVQVDATLNDLNTNISSETTTNTQSDTDLTSSDKATVNDADGVNNATY